MAEVAAVCGLGPWACSQRAILPRCSRRCLFRSLKGQVALLGMQEAPRRRGRRIVCSRNSLIGEEEEGCSLGADGGDKGTTKRNAEGADKEAQMRHLRELLALAKLDLEKARENSTQMETEAQKFAERAIELHDHASVAAAAAESATSLLEEQLQREASGKEALERARQVLEETSARLKLCANSEQTDKAATDGKPTPDAHEMEMEAEACGKALLDCERSLMEIQSSKVDLEKELARLNELAAATKKLAGAADVDVANAMVLAENAVALEVEAAQRLSDAEIALEDAAIAVGESVITPVLRTEDPAVELPPEPYDSALTATSSEDLAMAAQQEKGVEEVSSEIKEILEKLKTESDTTESGKSTLSKGKENAESGLPSTKPSTKKSSRFFPASFFSSGEAEEFSPASVFSGFSAAVKDNLPQVIVGACLLVGGCGFFRDNTKSIVQVVQSYTIEEVTTSTKPLVKNLYRLRSRVHSLVDKLSQQQVSEEEASLLDVLWLLLASVVFVPLFQKFPGGSPVLGYLSAGVLIGPHSLHIIQNVHATKTIAELGVVFLLFNIGLELSVERLSSMRKYVFGFGSSQVLVTALVTGLFVHYVSRVSGSAAIVIGNGLALSSTAVVLQILQERGESTSRHGRAAFSVLLFQDLAVVVLLILIPLLAPNSSNGGAGFSTIAEALGKAAIKGVIAISCIIAGGRLLLRPIYRSMADNQNAEIFAANTLLVVLGTSVLTAKAGLSMALGAFLAGLLLSETEFALQVESDIAPYRGLLLGLFFMTVGMSIDPKLFVAKFPVIMGCLSLLICGKTLLIAMLGKQFGLSDVAAIRAGLLLAPGGEFAFVAFKESVNQGIMSQELSSLLFLVVGLSMAITPWLAAAGHVMASKFEQQDVRSLLPAENETDDLEGHMIVCGFGRVGQIISQMLSERLIPFVALDVRSERVSMGRSLDLPVYFGDVGSKEVLHKVGAERAAAAVITLDTPGANYRAVWALSKHFPNVKTYVRAHDVDHGINLEKAGATAVVPETLEPSLQLAAAVLAEAKLPAAEIASTINEFRTRHLAELTELTKASGTSLGYGFSQINKPKGESKSEDSKFGGSIVAVP